MDARELRTKSAAELADELVKLRKEQFALRMQRATGQQPKSDQFGKVRRNIARLKTVLREKQAQLEGKLAELVRVARANDAISERLHRFTRRLLRLVPRAEALTSIEAGLREDFDAFHAALVLIGVPSDPAAAPFVRSVPADDPNLKSFESLFASGKPRCGQARDSQREFLFGPEGLELGSVALVPLGEKGSAPGRSSAS